MNGFKMLDLSQPASSERSGARSFKFFLKGQDDNTSDISWSRWEQHRGSVSHRIIFSAMLSALFLLSFSVPILVASYFSGYFELPIHQARTREEVFPESFSIGQADTFVEVQAGPGIDVVPGKDFLLVTWFKFRRIPISGDRAILISHFPDGKKPPGGFGLAISDERGVLRPMVYWSTKNGGARWYKFYEFEVPARTWVMFAITFREDKFLGLHAAALPEHGRPEIKLLGGYDIGSDTVSAADEGMILSVPHTSRYVARVGPVGTFIRKNMTPDLKDILKELTKNPKEIPSHFSTSEVGLWIPDFKGDQSSNSHQVILRNERAARK